MSDEPMRSRKRPEWAAGLRQLYDSVVEEPLPDSFSDLLSQFDQPGSDEQDSNAQKGRGTDESLVKGKGA